MKYKKAPSIKAMIKKSKYRIDYNTGLDKQMDLLKKTK